MRSRAWLFIFLLQIIGCSVLAQEENSIGGSSNDSFEDSSPRKWGSSFFSLSSVGLKQVQDGASSISNYGYVGANYKLDYDEKISIRPAFTFASAGYDRFGVNQKAETKLADFYVNYANYKLALLPGEWGLSGQFRIYFPTSEPTQNRKTITYLHSWLVAEKIFRHGWMAQYNFKPTYYVQSQKAYRNEYDRVNPDGSTRTFIEPGINPIGKLEHYISVAKYLNSTFTPQVQIGFEHQWNYTSEWVNRGSASRNQFTVAAGSEIKVNQDLRFILSMQSAVDLNETRSYYGDNTLRWQDNRGRDIQMFRPENTDFLLFTFWKIN